MKKVLAVVLVIALLCILAVSSTLSYFTDTDGNLNTMTVGKVDIAQNINDSDSGNISSALYPYTGKLTDSLDTNKNAVKAEVTVTLNAGSEAAFVRTIFAFEADGTADAVGKMIHVSYNKDEKVGAWAQCLDAAGNPITYTKNGTVYYLYSFTYTAALTANNTTATSLEKFCLDGSAQNSFSGGSYEILVISQAVQAQGFGNDVDAAFVAAFGEKNATNVAKWFNETPMA